MSNGTVQPGGLDKWVALAEMLASTVFAATKPEYAPIANEIGAGVIAAEQMKNAGTITDKLAYVQGIGRDAVAAYNTAKGTQALDPTAVDDIVASGLTTTIKIINGVHAKQMAAPAGGTAAPAAGATAPAPTTATSGLSSDKPAGS